jgi:thioredoxin
MRKFTYLFSAFLFLSFVACSNNAGNNEKTSENNPASAPEEGKVINLNAEAFKKLVWDYQKNPDDWKYNGDLPCIIDFYADWCRPCKMVAPIMEELAREYKGKIRIYKVNTDEQKELAGLFNIRSIPAVLFVPKSGKPQMSVGALPKPTFIQTINDVLKVK